MQTDRYTANFQLPTCKYQPGSTNLEVPLLPFVDSLVLAKFFYENRAKSASPPESPMTSYPRSVRTPISTHLCPCLKLISRQSRSRPSRWPVPSCLRLRRLAICLFIDSANKKMKKEREKRIYLLSLKAKSRILNEKLGEQQRWSARHSHMIYTVAPTLPVSDFGVPVCITCCRSDCAQRERASTRKRAYNAGELLKLGSSLSERAFIEVPHILRKERLTQNDDALWKVAFESVPLKRLIIAPVILDNFFVESLALYLEKPALWVIVHGKRRPGKQYDSYLDHCIMPLASHLCYWLLLTLTAEDPNQSLEPLEFYGYWSSEHGGQWSVKAGQRAICTPKRAREVPSVSYLVKRCTSLCRSLLLIETLMSVVNFGSSSRQMNRVRSSERFAR